jgi:hypothetical protein
VPRNAIFDAETSERHVFVRSPSGWEKCPVELGLTNNLDAAVRSGLTEGQVVALEAPAEWNPCTPFTTQSPPLDVLDTN